MRAVLLCETVLSGGMEEVQVRGHHAAETQQVGTA